MARSFARVIDCANDRLRRVDRVAALAPLTILSTSIIAALAPSQLPWVLDRLGVDPAMASGPVVTALQDLLSAAIYLGIATYYA
jgi:Mg/Co/Ni transporter MgtE